MTPAQLTSALRISRRLARKFARGDDAWAADLEQEAMLRIVKYAGKFDAAKGAWEDFARLRAVAAIRAARRRRLDVRGPVSRRYEQPPVESSVDRFDLMASDVVPADRVAAAREELDRIVSALTDDGLRLLLARETEETGAAMARERGVTRQAVSLRRQKALAKARRI